MALNSEDKKDVQKHMGKALANKVSKVTKDKLYKHVVKQRQSTPAGQVRLAESKDRESNMKQWDKNVKKFGYNPE